LSNVIITRLPFAVPDHPITASRLEWIEKQGRNAFMEYSVPEAILKLKQGLGRLIRSKKDHGICVILDGRVVTKPYGRAFLASIPECPTEFF
jgi:ATP-dependent DNA helicase DinG